MARSTRKRSMEGVIELELIGNQLVVEDLNIPIFDIVMKNGIYELVMLPYCDPEATYSYLNMEAQNGRFDLFIEVVPILDVSGTGVLTYKGRHKCLVEGGKVVALPNGYPIQLYDGTVIQVGTVLERSHHLYGTKFSMELLKDIRMHILNEYTTETIFEDEITIGQQLAHQKDRTVIHELHNVSQNSHVFRTFTRDYLDSWPDEAKEMDVIIPGNSSIKIIIRYIWNPDSKTSLRVSCTVVRNNSVERSKDIMVVNGI